MKTWTLGRAWLGPAKMVAVLVAAQAFMAGYSTPRENLPLLEQLLGTRQEMAALMDAPSFAHYNLRGGATLAASPDAVHSFLLDLAAAIRPKARHSSRLSMSSCSAVEQLGWRCQAGRAR